MIYLKLRLGFLPFSCGYCQNAHILKEEVSIMLENPETTLCRKCLLYVRATRLGEAGRRIASTLPMP
jgi:hypothetical protein